MALPPPVEVNLELIITIKGAALAKCNCTKPGRFRKAFILLYIIFNTRVTFI